MPLDHLLILPDETIAEESQQWRHWKPAEQIPCRDEIQAAQIAPDRRDRRAIGEPMRAAADLFGAHVGQLEIDLRRNLFAVKTQKFIRAAVGRRRVRAHAESVGNRLERFLFFADAAAAAPPPRLVHEGTMRRVHQTDDAGIHACREGRR